MRLTADYLLSVFRECGYDEFELNSAWLVMHRSREEKGIELRYALDCVRKQAVEVSVFVEHILQPSNVYDVEFVIEKLAVEIGDDDISAAECLRMLQAWRARTLVQIVIDKRNAAQRVEKIDRELKTCD